MRRATDIPFRALGNVNYIQPALPIQLADAEAGIRQVVAMLEEEAQEEGDEREVA
jgi:hypothetical protein